jgi:hypothetical protein
MKYKITEEGTASHIHSPTVLDQLSMVEMRHFFKLRPLVEKERRCLSCNNLFTCTVSRLCKSCKNTQENSSYGY